MGSGSGGVAWAACSSAGLSCRSYATSAARRGRGCPAACCAASPSIAPMIANRSRASSWVSGATVSRCSLPRPTPTMYPSCCSRCSALRTGVRLTPSRSAMSLSITRDPGASRPHTINSRSCWYARAMRSPRATRVRRATEAGRLPLEARPTHHAPWLRPRVPPVPHHLDPVHEHVAHPHRELIRLLVGRAVADRGRVAQHDAGVHSLAQPAAVSDRQPLRHGPGHLADRILQGEHLLLAHEATEDAGVVPVRARVSHPPLHAVGIEARRVGAEFQPRLPELQR